ncbi:hypothetical protein [Pseudodesulfovibrio sp.]|uniref:hypothetical protein n=1 Tax=unclassified Pseudodesulfovibrio TaxID=2661612 RepID=UPI003B00C924
MADGITTIPNDLGEWASVKETVHELLFPLHTFTGTLEREDDNLLVNNIQGVYETLLEKLEKDLVGLFDVVEKEVGIVGATRPEQGDPKAFLIPLGKTMLATEDVEEGFRVLRLAPRTME